MGSIWTSTARLPRFAPLRRDLKTDVLVVGGGIAGLLCAYLLKAAGADCALVEADRICGGTTMNTTAKVTAQHGLIYSRLIRERGLETARQYLEANLRALDHWRALCRDLEQPFEARPSGVYARTDRRKLDGELAALAQLNYPARFESAPPLPLATAGAVVFPDQGQVHPLQFAGALAKGLPVYEHTKVLELMPGRAVTTGGAVSAGHIIIATHFPILNKHGGYFLKLCQHRSYVIALENAPPIEGMYVDEDKRGLSFRDGEGLLLLGGGGHRTGKKGGGWRELEDFARRTWPQARVKARWAAQDCMSLDGVPYVGRYGKRATGLYVATGFNKWGMTSAMAAAEVLRDLVLGRENPYGDLFSPSRRMPGIPLAGNVLASAAGLLTPTVPRCPHMGCALKYNRAEHSWDCPCHGSRFREDGKLIEGPATDGRHP